jgi:AbrB family looped-hinge helix DNA binding protein
MDTLVTKQGQTVVPAAIRRRHHIESGSRLVWLDDGETIRVVPVPADSIQALRGRGRGLTERLFAERAAELGRS